MPEPAGRSLRFALYAGAVLLLVTGCSEEPVKPGTVPTTTSSPSSPSESPSALTPEQEVEAAVRAYYAELTRAAQTNDTSKLKTMTSTGCPCYGYVRAIERLDRQGLQAPDASWELSSVRVHDLSAGTALAEVRYVIDPYVVVNREGKTVTRYERQSGHLDLSLVTGAEGWIIGNSVDLEG